MADICEICMKHLEIYVYYNGLINYDEEIILCSKCQEEVDIIYENSGKSLKKCVDDVRRMKRK